MNFENIIKRLGKKQRFLIKAFAIEPLEISKASLISHITAGLEELELIEYSENFIHLSLLGKELSQIYREELFNDVPNDRNEILNRLLKIKAEKGPKLKKQEYLFLTFLSEQPRRTEEIHRVKKIKPDLLEKGLISENDDVLMITEEGKAALALCPKDLSDENPEDIFFAAEKIAARQSLQDKAEKFLSLYRQGLTYQEIGDLYELTRERVRQILNKTPNFQQYLEEYEQAKVQRELNKAKDVRLRDIEKSMAAQYPDRVDELWDWEKNGDLDPATIPAHSMSCEIWLKCPKDGHSWQKKPNDIVTSWKRYNSSGCPLCVGKVNKPQKQKALVEAYPDFVNNYWDFEKNDLIGLDPQKLTLGSNYKAWFKCPLDNNEWSANISSTIKQQWSLGNAGCGVCNGTANRRKGVWGKATPIGENFPERIAELWDFEKNTENNLNPEEITSGSAREAWFRCPVDGREWKAKIAAINKSWGNGNSGCPECRGFTSSEERSLAAIYPQFVAELWDFEKNAAENLQPDGLTCGTHREASFKCPADGNEWKAKINYIVQSYWKFGKTGCPVCGKGRNARRI